MKDNPLSENIIVDLRNNGGGSREQIRPFVKLLKKKKQVKNIYVIINFATASAAEIGAYLFSEDKRSKIVGENSLGAMAYGYGNDAISGKTACMDLTYVLTTKRIRKKFVEYEYVGLTPDIKLSNDRDWIEQLLELK